MNNTSFNLIISWKVTPTLDKGADIGFCALGTRLTCVVKVIDVALRMIATYIATPFLLIGGMCGSLCNLGKWRVLDALLLPVTATSMGVGLSIRFLAGALLHPALAPRAGLDLPLSNPAHQLEQQPPLLPQLSQQTLKKPQTVTQAQIKPSQQVTLKKQDETGLSQDLQMREMRKPSQDLQLLSVVLEQHKDRSNFDLPLSNPAHQLEQQPPLLTQLSQQTLKKPQTVTQLQAQIKPSQQVTLKKQDETGLSQDLQLILSLLQKDVCIPIQVQGVTYQMSNDHSGIKITSKSTSVTGSIDQEGVITIHGGAKGLKQLFIQALRAKAQEKRKEMREMRELSQDLQLLSVVLEQHKDRSNSVEVDGITYDMRVTTSSCVYIECRNTRRQLIIDKAGVVVKTESFGSGMDAEAIKKRIIKMCAVKAFELSSEYTDKKFFLVKRGLEKIPGFHMQKCARHIRSHYFRYHNSITVNYKRVNYKNRTLKISGIDTGGIARDYISALVENFIKHYLGELFFPFTTASLETRSYVPSLKDSNDQNLSLLCDFGIVLRYCLEEGDMPIGDYFSSKLFKMISMFTREELDGSFNAILSQKKYEMLRILLEMHLEQGESVKAITVLQELIEACLINKELGEKLTKEEEQKLLKAAEEVARYNSNLLNPFMQEKDKISNPKGFIDTLRKWVFASAACAELIPQLRGIHAVAKGLNDSHINTSRYHDYIQISEKNYMEVSKKIQGEIDRRAICDFMICGEGNEGKPFHQKVAWLKEWILDESTSEAQIRRFVWFVTGAPTLPPGQNITVDAGYPANNVMPTGHTCAHRLSISDKYVQEASGLNDKTKEAFINVIKISMESEQHFDL